MTSGSSPTLGCCLPRRCRIGSGWSASSTSVWRLQTARRARGRARRCSRWCTRCCSVPTRSMIARCCVSARRLGCSTIACWRRRRLGRFCARVRSGTCASSTACSARRSVVPGGRAAGRARSGWWSISTRSLSRCTAPTSRARARLYPQARLSPDHRDARGHAGDAADPTTAGLRQHAAWREAFRR
jgi:hypothetical protein